MTHTEIFFFQVSVFNQVSTFLLSAIKCILMRIIVPAVRGRSFMAEVGNTGANWVKYPPFGLITTRCLYTLFLLSTCGSLLNIYSDYHCSFANIY